MHKASRTRTRKKYSSARAFYLTILMISAIAILSWLRERQLRHGINGANHALFRRSHLTIGDGLPSGSSVELVPRHQACRLVNTAKDQCAFVRANCPDEEAGLFSYLQLYYCKLHKAQPLAFTILILWLGLLFSTIGIAASDFFCINLSTIASILGMSESMAGVTFLAFGNGSPDVFSTFAAMKTNSGSMAVGELIGAAGFITAVVAGSMALVRPFKVARKSFVRDVGFFIVAASFSMVFLADGHLHLWECAVMVAFYLFYVVTVVLWHWYLGRRSRRRLLEDAARGNFHIPGVDEVEDESYHDEDDEDAAARGSRAPTRTVSASDFANLERGGSPMLRHMDEEADADDQTRDRYLAEISSNMRVSRRRPGERRNTINPIRPSLVGALEFRAVLSSLQKSRNIQTIPINLRRYSDDPAYTAAQQQDNLLTRSNPDINYDDVDAHDATSNTSLRPSADGERTGPNRVRAVSANDALGLRFDPKTLQSVRVPEIDLLSATPPGMGGLRPLAGTADHRPSGRSPSPPAPSLSLSPAADEFGYLSMSPAPMSPLQHGRSGELLAPPEDNLLGSRNHAQSQIDTQQGNAGLLEDSPKLIGKPKVPRIQIPQSPGSQSSRGSTPRSPFPAYHNDANYVSSSRTPSIRLPPSSIGSESTFHQNLYQEPEEKPMRWWPYTFLPPPQILISTLFPTLYSWKDKNIWEKLLGIVAAPSVFLLAITLPTVEVDKEDDEDLPIIVDPDPGLLSPRRSRSRSASTVTVALPPDSPSTGSASESEGLEPPNVGKYGNQGTGSPSINIVEPENGTAIQALHPPGRQLNSVTNSPSPTQSPSSPKEWNRWLVVTQIFTGPFFIVVLLWANTDPSLSPRNLLLPCLYALIASLLTFAILILTTTPSHTPKYRYLLCFFGFIISIAWISTIANEVVGVLKAFGVILGISDAILGLTVFAVGNSLGDLVADITVAKLGYPVMALSACFGGPMLNILLGIGLSGLYLTIQGGERNHEKHPGRPIRYKPYQIEVGGTLLISGVTLFITLAGLLVVVPLRGWWMDRKVGWGLVALCDFFAKQLSGRWPDMQQDGSYFIDADGQVFEHVLRYLRHDIMPIFYDEVKGHEYALYLAVLEQARFFGVEPLQKWLEEHKYVQAVKIVHSARVLEGLEDVSGSTESHVKIEHHVTWKTRKVNARGEADDEYKDEEVLKVLEVRKMTVLDPKTCVEQR
ncbi:MAG: hypothetical protein ASARMPREDX12_008688 [Alectoria sarmentosa]|nr:MAG: hypothetical protein ASARMPREDX12_008688 [Alectoria sarmentosa]